MNRKSLKLQQLERKMGPLIPFVTMQQINGNWIKTIRETLGMSAQQLASRLSLSRQAVTNMESREKNGAITIQSMQEVAGAMGMKFVYGLIPVEGSFEDLVTKKARELATRIVMRTHQTMALEDQENEKARIEKAIEEMTMSIKNEMPKALWD
jgi:predicted DNA-binding mobile mystery protein A